MRNERGEACSGMSQVTQARGGQFLNKCGCTESRVEEAGLRGRREVKPAGLGQ